MSTREEEIRNLRDKHASDLAKKEAELQAEMDVREHLPETPCRPRVHPMSNHPLYGVTAWVNYNRTRYESIRDTADPTTDDIETLTRSLPPVGSYWVQDSCLAHMPAMAPVQHANATITPMAPYWLEVDEDCELQWFTWLPTAQRIIRVAVQLPPHRVAWRSAWMVEFRGGFRYEDKRVGWHALLAPGVQTIRWWSSETDAGRHTLWWDETADAGRIVAGVVGAMKVRE